MRLRPRRARGKPLQLEFDCRPFVTPLPLPLAARRIAVRFRLPPALACMIAEAAGFDVEVRP